MKTVYIGMSEMAVSKNPTEQLMTFSLGSCIAVALYDPGCRAGGLIHCMLPASRIHKAKATEKPCMFVDTGLPELLDRLLELGSREQRLLVWIAGASCMSVDNQAFRIGERNHHAVQHFFAQHELEISAASVGGHHSRSLTLNIATGRCVVKHQGKETELCPHRMNIAQP